MAKVLNATRHCFSAINAEYIAKAVAAIGIALAMPCGQPALAADLADLVVSNARVFTGSYVTGKAGPSDVPQMTSCLACAGGKIIYVGDPKGISALRGPHTRELN